MFRKQMFSQPNLVMSLSASRVWLTLARNVAATLAFLPLSCSLLTFSQKPSVQPLARPPLQTFRSTGWVTNALRPRFPRPSPRPFASPLPQTERRVMAHRGDSPYPAMPGFPVYSPLHLLKSGHCPLLICSIAVAQRLRKSTCVYRKQREEAGIPVPIRCSSTTENGIQFARRQQQ